jgi:hypothetical protein
MGSIRQSDVAFWLRKSIAIREIVFPKTTSSMLRANVLESFQDGNCQYLPITPPEP